jgi:hypothetical protein
MLAKSSPVPEPLPLPDDAVLYRHAFPTSEQAWLLRSWLDKTAWRQHIASMGAST